MAVGIARRELTEPPCRSCGGGINPQTGRLTEMPKLTVWEIDREDRYDIDGTKLPDSAAQVWQGINCLETMNVLMTCHTLNCPDSGSLEAENGLLRDSYIDVLEQHIRLNGEDSQEGLDEAHGLITLARETRTARQGKQLIVGVWI